jgi:hypothetical protein
MVALRVFDPGRIVFRLSRRAVRQLIALLLAYSVLCTTLLLSGVVALAYAPDAAALSESNRQFLSSPSSPPSTLAGNPQVSQAIALVRHAASINGNGRVEGSLRQLTAESVTLNGGGTITDDLEVPGTPGLLLNGSPHFGGTIQGSGSAQPTNHKVTLNGAGSTLGHLVTRTDPIPLPVVAAPPASTGTRSVTINAAGQRAGDFATLRDLTLNGNVGMLAVPPGTYRNFVANGGGGFILGVSGATQPSTYNLNTLTLNGQSTIQIAGPVNLTLSSALTLNASMGSAAEPSQLNLQVSSGSVTLNGGSALYAVLTAPASTVIINGNAKLVGALACDRLTINGGGLLHLTESALPPINQAPVVSAGPSQTVTLPSAAVLSGVVTDDGLPVGSSITTIWSQLSGPGPVTFANSHVTATTAEFSMPGTYVLRLSATDSQLTGNDDIVVTVLAPNQAPIVNAGVDQSVTLPDTATLHGAVTDDGLPAGRSVTTSWTRVSGPGPVSFSDASALITAVTFSAPGLYVMRLTATDTELTGFAEVAVTVSQVNRPPSVACGPSQTVSLPVKSMGFFLNDLNGFNAAAGTPPVVVDFDNIEPGTDITARTLSGITFDRNDSLASSAPLIVAAAVDTFTPSGFAGVIDVATNKLTATSGDNVLSPGGPELGPLDTNLENDDLRITFAQPVSAVGFDLLFQSLDSFSAVGLSILDVNGNVLYSNPLLPTGTSAAGGAPGGSVFVGFVSSRANIAAIVIDEQDDNNIFPDANIGFDAFRIRRLVPTTAIVNLSGDVNDDGLPSNSLQNIWTKTSGPGSVTFADPTQPLTTASFSEAGVYNLRLSASDSELTSSADVTIKVNEGVVNYPPNLAAGADQTIILPANTVSLNAIVSDDEQPAGSTPAVTWSLHNGPGNVAFGDPNSPVTTATFAVAGTYVLRITASDSELIATADVQVRVLPAGTVKSAAGGGCRAGSNLLTGRQSHY